MARYLGPKHKICRRIGSCIWGSPKCPSVKRPYPPGHHGQNLRRKHSVYGTQLLEKQRIRMHYGILERQMRKTFAEAQRMGGVTGVNLLMLLESRVDCVVYRMGWAPTIHAARQLVSHGHILINGKRIDKPNIRVMPGDNVAVRQQSRKVPMIVEGSEHPPHQMPEYLDRPPKAFEGRMTALPNAETIPFKADTLSVIGYYSR